jgi:hypothetical protein
MTVNDDHEKNQIEKEGKEQMLQMAIPEQIEKNNVDWRREY